MNGEHEAAGESWPVAAVKTYGKAIVATAVTTCAYLAGAIDNPDAGIVEAFGSVSGAEWLGLIPFVAGAAGLTVYAPYRSSRR